MPILAHLGNVGWTKIGFIAQAFFLHIFIDEQFLKLLITYRYNVFLPKCKKLCHLAEHPYSRLLLPRQNNTDSVVYNDSIFSREKQENAEFARIGVYFLTITQPEAVLKKLLHLLLKKFF